MIKTFFVNFLPGISHYGAKQAKLGRTRETDRMTTLV